MTNLLNNVTVFILLFFMSCGAGSNEEVLDSFFEEKVHDVQNLSPSKVIELAVFCENIDLKSIDNVRVEYFRKKGVDLENKIIYYDISKVRIDSSEITKLEVYLNSDVDCFQIINPNASLCYFTDESKTSFESLVFLTWTLQERRPLCLSKAIFDDFADLRNYYNTNVRGRNNYE